jgi:predicted naringenin-chalcone synthase
VTLPAKSARVVRRLVEEFLQDRGMEAADITHWALHPGGQKVIDRLGELIGLPKEKLAPTRRVLREYGNISSVSVWFVLHDILTGGMEPGELCAMVAFGAGLSAHVTLLRLTGQKGVTGLKG